MNKIQFIYFIYEKLTKDFIGIHNVVFKNLLFLQKITLVGF